jgi:hypothetical protein
VLLQAIEHNNYAALQVEQDRESIMKAIDRCSDIVELGVTAVEQQGQQLATSYAKLNR